MRFKTVTDYHLLEKYASEAAIQWIALSNPSILIRLRA